MRTQSRTALGPDDERLLGNSDFQSLADLGNSFEVVRRMRVLPFGRDAVIRLALTITLPLPPLVLTVVPLEDLVKWLIGILF